jgi:cell wall-associated NlpC family hydrolase
MRNLLRVLIVPAVCTAAACATTGSAAAVPRPFPAARAASTAAPEARDAARAVPRGPAADPGRLSLASAVVSTAMGYRGVPYKLGGSDPSGFDCSGLVQFVMRQHAITMPRTVAEQFTIGEMAPSIEAGDLVFFQTIGSKASHVGIAIDAETFIHAPNSRGAVRIERLDSQYWSDRFLGAKRVF